VASIRPAILITVLVAGCHTHTDAYQEARDYFLAGDYNKAVPYLQQCADSDPYCMSALAYCYDRGLGGLQKDDAKGLYYYQKAADQNNAGGYAGLGYLYYYGKAGLPKDQAKAALCWQKAIDLGDKNVEADLAYMYLHGEGGLPKDEPKAAQLFQTAADEGQAYAIAQLGLMYRDGKGGLPKDGRKAAQLFQKGADKGDPASMALLGEMYGRGEGGLPRDQFKGFSLLKTAADKGVTNAMVDLGVIYGEAGRYFDRTKSAAMFQEAADHQDPLGMIFLSKAYDLGNGVPKNPAKAEALRSQAIKLNPNAEALASSMQPSSIPAN
jgi:TPR repeat protein